MDKIEYASEVRIGDVTFIKDDEYALEPGCFAQLREVVCAYQIKFKEDYTRYQLVVLKSRPVPNAPCICVEVYLADQYDDFTKGCGGVFDNVAIPNLIVTPEIMEVLFRHTADFMNTLRINKVRFDSNYGCKINVDLKYFSQFLRESLVNSKDTYLTIFQSPYHIVIEDAEFTRKCGGCVNFYITSHIQRHIVMGSVLVSYGKNRVRITPLCLNRLKRDMLNGLTKQLTTPLFRTYVIDGPTYRCIKNTSSSVLEWLKLYIGFVEATYVAHYNILEQFHTTTRQLQVPATPKALTTLHPSYISELGNRMGIEDAFGSVMPIDETLLRE